MSALSNEMERLAALLQYDVYGTLPETEFDHLTTVAAALFKTADSALTLVGADRVWVKSRHQDGEREISRYDTFCHHAICQSEPMVVLNTLGHPLVADNPYVHADPPVRFYAAAPLVTPQGQRIGTICVFDPVPRAAVSPSDVTALAALANAAMDLLAARRDRLAAELLAQRALTIEHLLAVVAGSGSVEQAVLDVAADLEARYHPASRALYQRLGDGDTAVWAELGLPAERDTRLTPEYARLLEDSVQHCGPRFVAMPPPELNIADPLAVSMCKFGTTSLFVTPFGIEHEPIVFVLGFGQNPALTAAAETELVEIVKAIGPAIRRVAEEARALALKRADDRARSALQHSFHMMFQDNPVPMWVVSAGTGRFMLVNQAAIRFYGWSSEEFLTMKLADIVAPGDPRAAIWPFAEYRGNMAETINMRHVRANGTMARIAMVAQPHLPAGDGAWLVALWDVTETLAVREELSRSNDALKDLAGRLNQQAAELIEAHRLANLGTWTLTTDLEGMTWSDDVYRMIGCTRQDQEPSLAAMLQSLQAADRKLFVGLIDDIRRDGRGREIHARLLRKEGRVRQVRIEARVSALGGQPGLLFGYIQDVSDRWETEQALRRSEKLATLGHLTSGIAHDFNNLLTVVTLNLEEAIEDRTHDADLQSLLVPALEAAQRGADLTANLLSYAKQAPLRPQVITLDDFFAGLRPLMRQSLGSRYGLHLTVHDKRCAPLVDVSQLQTALIKILLNAKEAMPDGGDVFIDARRILMPNAEFPLDLAAGSYALITIKDTGIGIPPDVLPHVFEPFYTTKDVGAGNGLGLSMVDGFLRQSGGKVLAESEPGKGTTLSLFLPLQASAGKESPSAADPAEKIRVLVVEDQPAVLATVVRMLTQLGFAVSAVEGANQALAELDRRADFAVLFTDIILPGGMDGIALARIVRERFPAMRILLTTGFTEHDLAGSDVPGTAILMKPYKRHDLMQKMGEILQLTPAGV